MEDLFKNMDGLFKQLDGGEIKADIGGHHFEIANGVLKLDGEELFKEGGPDLETQVKTYVEKMTDDTKIDEVMCENLAFRYMQFAFDILKNVKASRENSLTITKLEEAMMWCNKDRANKGELDKTSTHVS